LTFVRFCLKNPKSSSISDEFHTRTWWRVGCKQKLCIKNCSQTAANRNTFTTDSL